MARSRKIKIWLTAVLALGLVGVGATQVREIIKILGVGAAVREFGGDINNQLNRLTGHEDTDTSYTKVVPIITIGLNSRGAIGAAQVKGAKVNVDKVKSVAAPEAELFGDELKIRALIPTDTDNPTSIGNLKTVEGVGVSGIVDLKL